MIRRGTAFFGINGPNWRQKVNREPLRSRSLERARKRVMAHGLGAMLRVYDESARNITNSMTTVHRWAA